MCTESCFSLFLLGWFFDFFFFFLANNSSFCIFLGQGAIPFVKELETIMLMTTVKTSDKNPTKNPVNESQHCVDETVVTAEM